MSVLSPEYQRISITAIGEWVADAPQRVLALLGFRPDPLTGLIRPPHATTIRLVLAAADGDALDRAIGDFLQERKAPAPERTVIAVDCKTLRGSRTADRTVITLIAAMTHSGQVLAQRQIDGKSNEIPAFAPLLDGIDLTDAVITADALHTQRDHATYLHERGGAIQNGGSRSGEQGRPWMTDAATGSWVRNRGQIAPQVSGCLQ
ncbi:ISAs1 family transposase [Streptomyces europaeiscabiei]|uniref:ISAs1 family transposase n=1 Tax=Streptomyces europaeiscabiei TaxID=146819 RepID=UPI0029A0C4DF|nr:ISAs1 family transposase [Streptomyces europaeiscabiei]MDX3589361.1 ISAs1 family transposase [Streptomyces europaeiscabiei]